MYKLAYVVIAILMGTLCYAIAKKRGLANPGLWFFGGVLFHVFAVGAVMFTAKYFNLRKKGGSP